MCNLCVCRDVDVCVTAKQTVKNLRNSESKLLKH